MVQFLIGVIDFIGLRFKVKPEAEIFRTLLKIELTVQMIEFVAYLVLTSLFFSKGTRLGNITLIRYADWYLTTPIMMTTLMGYLSGETRFRVFLKKYKRPVVFVVVMDTLMLVAGLQNELQHKRQDRKKESEMVCRRHSWIYIGFFPFILMFGCIYHVFHKQLQSSYEKRFIFAWFLIIWTVYGMAAFGSYTSRNSSYNILDIFSKNITGLFLVWKLSQYRIKK